MLKPVRFRVLGVSFTLEIVDVQMQPSVEVAQFSNVDFGVLTVRGPVKPIICPQSAHSLIRTHVTFLSFLLMLDQGRLSFGSTSSGISLHLTNSDRGPKKCPIVMVFG
jgi:hypothetical protein